MSRFNIGDTIELTFRGVVVYQTDMLDRLVGIQPAGLGGRLTLNHRLAAEVKVLKRASVAEGDVINGGQLRGRMWRRGTVIQDESAVLYMLDADARWISSESGRAAGGWDFDDFGAGETLIVKHLP
jgi:hypothetical protein